MKKDVNPIVVDSYEDIIDEVERPLVEYDLLSYGVAATK